MHPDCIIHAGSRANDQYFKKAGPFARDVSRGHQLKNTGAYCFGLADDVIQFLEKLQASLPDKFKHSSKSYIFKQMWEATCLNRRVPFEQGWQIDNPNEVFLVDGESTFGFSSSEMEVLNMFRYIYNDSYPADFGYLLRRWPPKTIEYQIAISWLDSPFYF